MRKITIAIAGAILLGAVAAYAAQKTTFSQREVRDPRLLAQHLEANATDAQTRIAAIEGGTADVALDAAKIWVGSAADLQAAVAMSGDATIATNGAVTIAEKAVTYAKIQDVAGASVIGRAGGSAGVSAAITAGTEHHVLRRSGTDIGFGLLGTANLDPSANIALTQIANVSGLSVVGVTGNAAASAAAITAASDHHVLRRSGSAVGFGLLVNDNIDAAAAIAHSKLAAVAPGYLLVGNATSNATAVEVTGDVSMSNTGVVSIDGGAKAAINGLIAYLADGLWTIATLANSDTPNKFKTTTTTAFTIGGITYTKVAQDDLTFSQDDTINGNGATNTLYGGWLIQTTSAGVVSTLAETGQTGIVDQEYESAAAALASAQDITPTAGNAVLGYLVIAYDATGSGDEGGTWTANSTDLTTNATATWTDGDIKVLPTAL